MPCQVTYTIKKVILTSKQSKVQSIPCSLAAINDDVFWHDPSLQHAHFGMVATPSEETWGFNLEVGDPLLVVIHDTKAIFF